MPSKDGKRINSKVLMHNTTRNFIEVRVMIDGLSLSRRVPLANLEDFRHTNHIGETVMGGAIRAMNEIVGLVKERFEEHNDEYDY